MFPYKYNKLMAPLGLEDDEVTDVMKYVLNSWGDSSDEIVAVEEVEKVDK